jgi:hypothetical protein
MLVDLPIAAEKMPYIAKTEIKIHIDAAIIKFSKWLMDTPKRINVMVNPKPCRM